MAYSAIETKFIGATSCRGARTKATVSNTNPGTGRKESVTIPFQYGLTGSEGDQMAAWALIRKLEWNVQGIIEGASNNGYMFVLIPGWLSDIEILGSVIRNKETN